jgi:hypothetical protein
MIAKWGYCKSHDRDFDDPTLVRSDWWPWLQAQSWFVPDRSLVEQYPHAVESILRPKALRKEFFRQVLNPGLPASEGYKILAQLLARRHFRTVLTTNFDQLIAQEARSTAAVHELEEIKTPNDFAMFSTNPLYPQVIYLHGSVDHYTDQNVENETQKLNSALVDLLRPALRDHPLVVVGYRGAEPSVMKHLLLDQASYCARYRHGIYWCTRDSSNNNSMSPLLAQLTDHIGTNLQFVKIDGFDELMEDLVPILRESDRAPLGTRIPHGSGHAIRSITNDLRPALVSIDKLDTLLLRAKIRAYCEAVRLPKPEIEGVAELLDAMTERGLAIVEDRGASITNGGQLLFANEVANQNPFAKIVISMEGPRTWLEEISEQTTIVERPEVELSSEETTIVGNLWHQLDLSLTLLARVNRAFRLKGAKSLDVYPYPPLALKELLTNLIAHRDYEVAATSTITITPGDITFWNPGGLTDHVQQQLRHVEIQEAIRASTRGIKGYRNPVIADFFYSAGAMDKKGSGLPDVLDEAANNLNEVEFGPAPDNTGFIAKIRARPETLAVDRVTRTAKAIQRELRYSPNLLSILEWPANIWKLATIASIDEFSLEISELSPPYCVYKDWIWTFANPLDTCVDKLRSLALEEEIHYVPSSELLQDIAATGAIARLLNSSLHRFLSSLGLRTRAEGSRIRAFFPSLEQQPREITYRGLFKQATRTVTKPIVSRSTGKISFWEHKAVGLRFERFSTMWCLSLTPGYVFTMDGLTLPIESVRIGPLSTKRSARDYNPSVLHDLVFWSRVLSKGAEASFSLPLASVLATTIPNPQGASVELSSLIPTVVFQEGGDAASNLTTSAELTDIELQDLQSAIEDAILLPPNDGITQ